MVRRNERARGMYRKSETLPGMPGHDYPGPYAHERDCEVLANDWQGPCTCGAEDNEPPAGPEPEGSTPSSAVTPMAGAAALDTQPRAQPLTTEVEAALRGWITDPHTAPTPYEAVRLIPGLLATLDRDRGGWYPLAGHRVDEAHECFQMNCRGLGREVQDLRTALGGQTVICPTCGKTHTADPDWSIVSRHCGCPSHAGDVCPCEQHEHTDDE